jgi:hypothetical protein
MPYSSWPLDGIMADRCQTAENSTVQPHWGQNKTGPARSKIYARNLNDYKKKAKTLIKQIFILFL